MSIPQDNKNFTEITKSLGGIFFSAAIGWVFGRVLQFSLGMLALGALGELLPPTNYNQVSEYLGLTGIFVGSIITTSIIKKPALKRNRVLAAMAITTPFWYFDLML